MKIDLHVHSKYSHDGVMSIEEILDTAKEKGLDAVAVCDHDRFFSDEIPDHQVKVIRGCEFSTKYGHLLGLFLERPIEASDFETICKEIHDQDGIAILAHPFRHNRYKNVEQMAIPFVDGIEVINARATRNDPLANLKAYELAKKYKLLVFAGSDAHTKNEIANAYVVTENQDDLKVALHESVGTVCGRRAKAIDTAKSQLVKIRKAKKGNIIKWFMFACKCALLDLIHIKENEYVTYSKDW